MICNELGISNHSKSASEWVKTSVITDAVYWKDNKVKYEVVPGCERHDSQRCHLHSRKSGPWMLK